MDGESTVTPPPLPLIALLIEVGSLTHIQQNLERNHVLPPVLPPPPPPSYYVCVFVVWVPYPFVFRSLVPSLRGTALELVYQPMADEERLLGGP